MRWQTGKTPNDWQEPKNKNVQVHDYLVVQHLLDMQTYNFGGLFKFPWEYSLDG